MALKHVVVDGSNIATEGRTAPSLAQLDERPLGNGACVVGVEPLDVVVADLPVTVTDRPVTVRDLATTPAVQSP